MSAPHDRIFPAERIYHNKDALGHTIFYCNYSVMKQNSLKNLDLFYKTGLDFCDCFGKEKLRQDWFTYLEFFWERKSCLIAE